MKPARILTYAWLTLLAVGLLVSIQTAYRDSLKTEEYAYACDPFGYLRMAKEIRKAGGEWKYPDFRLESAQTRLLIDFMRSRNVPLKDWDELVAPHAHHYMPQSNYVGVQYPPGTGLALAIFPEGQAVYGLNRTVIWVFALAGVIGLIIAFVRETWASAGLLILSLCLGLTILTRVGALSFSINAMLIPILLACVFSVLSLRFKARQQDNAALLTALGAGLCLGFATLVRLPVVLLVPGFLILLWGRRWWPGLKSLPIVFGAAVFFSGLLPVFIHQQKIAGAWYLPTYSGVDASVPTLEKLKDNFRFYFGDAWASADNWGLDYAVVGFVGFVLISRLARRPRVNQSLGLTRRRLALAALVTWVIPTLYFLTHSITGPHYMIPSTFGTAGLLGIGAFAMEASSERLKDFQPRRVLWWIAILLVVWPGLALVRRVWTSRASTPAPAQAIAHQPIVLPPDLTDERAWVWADLLTGSLWYYANKPAFKIQFSNRETRALLFKFVSERGEPQYLIQDSGTMQQFMDEIVQLGGKLEPRGKVDGQPYFLVQWPDGGPRTD